LLIGNESRIGIFMALPKQTFARYIKEFKLKELFNDLGWDNANAKYPISVDPPKGDAQRTGSKLYSLTGLAQKKEFLVLLCEPKDGLSIPDAAERKKIDNAITKLHYEHLIVYVDGNRTRQHWELVIREHNKPIVCRPIDYYAGQAPELLFQKLEGLFFAYEDEEKLSIVDVRSRVMANFEKNAEVVTKKFYDKFSKEHKSFLKFIEGIESTVDKEWYASLMLNRLMFIYFIQKKGFLDENKDYLRIKLSLVQQRKGKNKFYSFYRDFLLVLFHKGLGSPLHDKKFEEDFGRIPYLNGGLFDVHKLEHDNPKIQIEDKAFEKIFDFFDEYNWHLDTRVTATGKDINPDVIGYIFEKYINDRAAMGAYYTKEDITEYISKNCIVPWLFDEVKRTYPKPFAKDSEVWSLLKGSSDNYIYPTVKYGIVLNSSAENGFVDLPKDIQEGLDSNISDLIEKRKCWNKPAPDIIALPTEIYREVIARRKRYYEIKKKIEEGEIIEINDFITYNLNIRQFVQDIIQRTDDAKLVMEFYKAVRKVTILDPTCGSGAFLFAALNVLEPLYYACATRMQEFVIEDACLPDRQGKGKHKFFEEQLTIINAPEHPSMEYFIYKSIILHNLYGVDIMKEAVEIAKLRLFLKLVATVDVDYKKSNLGLEPLPDIDFNIRSGNTLVGYATLTDLDKSMQGGLFGSKEKDAILEQADVVSRAYERFKDSQLVMHTDPKSYKGAKDELIKRLEVLNDHLNTHLSVTYLGENHSIKAYEAWLTSHQPFHWLAEYYTTIAQGGFDVIIGNPPYVEYTKIKSDYTIRELSTEKTANLYPFCIERSSHMLSPNGMLGMIIPISGLSNRSMGPLQDLIRKVPIVYASHFHQRPAQLFEGVLQRLTIVLCQMKQKPAKPHSTIVNRWRSETRSFLFQNICYLADEQCWQRHFLKLGLPIEESITKKFFGHNEIAGFLSQQNTRNAIHYRTAGGGYWVTFLNTEFETESLSNKKASFQSEYKSKVFSAILNSNLFWWYYSISFDQFNFKDYMIFGFRCKYPDSTNEQKLNVLSEQLERELLANANHYVIESRTRGSNKTITYQKHLSKGTMDEIDKVLAKHYGFTNEELDFIINYDIKYRMGKELEGEE
jgi:Eco57I restriction-modification methylase